MTDHVDLTTITLGKGSHAKGSKEPCIMEAVTWFAGEPWSDRPRCVSPILGSFGRSWNDALDDATRQQLKPFIPRMINTVTDGREPERFWALIDWLIRAYTPPWLRLAGLDADADTIAGLAQITGPEQIVAARPAIDGARQRAAAARDAARDAAWAAARDAARARLKPTVDALQTSALALLDRLCAPAAEPALAAKP